ncbi:MAG: hypothetical protein O7J95_16305, partial [Planctomycetota bacterium]|nr:hypothetical protein [Planctomycetota bacterium]
AELERQKKINEELRRKLKKLAPDTDFSASDEEFDEGFDEQTATTERIRRYEKAFRAQAEIPDVLARLGKLTEHFQSAGLRPKAESVDLSNRTGTLQADCRLELRADGWGRIKKALDGVRELLPAARILKLEVAAQDGAVLATVGFRTGKGGPRSSAAFLAPLTALLEAAPELASEDWKLEAVATSSRCEVEYHAADITLEVLTTLLERLAQSGNTLAHHVTIRQATTGKGASVKIRLEARNDASKARR